MPTIAQPILAGGALPGALQPFTIAKPRFPQPILPQRPAPTAIQPHADNAFALPANFSFKPRGSGQPLPEAVQKKMESFFNTSFADVRVHVGHEAASIGALAFTHGTDLYFAPGQYNPQATHGQQLLGHELTHVVQQRAGRVRNPMGAGIAVVQDPALEAEADRMGLRVASANWPVQAKMAVLHRAVLPGGRKQSPTIEARYQPSALQLMRSTTSKRVVYAHQNMRDAAYIVEACKLGWQTTVGKATMDEIEKAAQTWIFGNDSGQTWTNANSWSWEDGDEKRKYMFAQEKDDGSNQVNFISFIAGKKKANVHVTVA